MDAGRITTQYPDDTFPGHAAWLDWPWKLHRIQSDADTVAIELYNLADDPDEKADVADRHPDRVAAMRPISKNGCNRSSPASTGGITDTRRGSCAMLGFDRAFL